MTSGDEPVGHPDETISDLTTDEAPGGGLRAGSPSDRCVPDPSTNWCYTDNEHCELWSSPC